MGTRSSPSDREPLRPVRGPAAGGGRRSGPGGASGGSGSPWAQRHYDYQYELYDDLSPGLELIYGRNSVREALRGRRQVHTILVGAGEAGDELVGAVRGWCSGLAGVVPPIDRVAVAELTARLGTSEHQGIAAVVDPYPYLDADGLLRSYTVLVALDGIQDPQNLGAIIRTAEAVRAGVLIPRHQAAEVTAAVVKASAGATEHAAVAIVRNLGDFLENAKKAGFWIYGAEPEADNLYSGQDYTYPTCFVLGSEGRGIRSRVASLCDVMVRIPLVGKVESLNVSVSAAILLYEAMRQRDFSGGCSSNDNHLSGESRV